MQDKERFTTMTDGSCTTKVPGNSLIHGEEFNQHTPEKELMAVSAARVEKEKERHFSVKAVFAGRVTMNPFLPSNQIHPSEANC